jgi:ribosomal protein S20
MPNTKSAERRMRNSARKNLRTISSAFDKAAKSGTVHRATADRKKSRLALRLAKAK